MGVVLEFPRRIPAAVPTLGSGEGGATDRVSMHGYIMREWDNQDMAIPMPETLSDVLDAWRLFGVASGHSQRTIVARRGTIVRLSRSCDVFEATEDDLIAWMASLVGRDGMPMPKSSKSTYRAHLRSWFAWLQRTGRRSDDPAKNLPALRPGRGLPHPVTAREVQEILAACADSRAWQTRAYVTLAAFAGLRVHEIAKIRGEDFRHGEIVIHGKGDVSSTVPTVPIIERLRETMPRTGFWFPTNAMSGHVHRCSVSTAINRAMKRAGVVAVPHALRHYYCTEVLRATHGDLRKTQRLARHASPATTAIYTQVLDRDAAEAAAAIPGAA